MAYKISKKISGVIPPDPLPLRALPPDSRKGREEKVGKGRKRRGKGGVRKGDKFLVPPLF